MNTSDLIRRVVAEAGVSMIGASRAMGKNDNYFASVVARGSTPKADTLAAMLDACGYTLAAIPHGDVPASALVVDPPDGPAAD